MNFILLKRVYWNTWWTFRPLLWSLSVTEIMCWLVNVNFCCNVSTVLVAFWHEPRQWAGITMLSRQLYGFSKLVWHYMPSSWVSFIFLRICCNIKYFYFFREIFLKTHKHTDWALFRLVACEIYQMKNYPLIDIFMQYSNRSIFFDKSIVQWLFNLKGIFSLLNTEETQTLIISIFCMLFK